MPTFFLLGRTTHCPIHTLHLGPSWLFEGVAELHAWGISILYCNPANQNERPTP